MIVAIGVAPRYSWDELLLCIALVAIFMSYIPLQTILRHWFVHPQTEDRMFQSDFWAFVFSLLAVSSGILLLFRGFWLLVPIGAVAAACFLGNFLLVRHIRKGVASDLVAVAGLTASAPAMSYVATSRLDQTAVSLWFLNLLFFGTSVFYVHMKLLATGMKKEEFSLSEKISVGRLNVVYTVVVLAMVFFMAYIHLIARFAVFAFLPMTVHALVGTVRLSSRVRFRNLGFALLAQSLVFSFLILLTEHR